MTSRLVSTSLFFVPRVAFRSDRRDGLAGSFSGTFATAGGPAMRLTINTGGTTSVPRWISTDRMELTDAPLQLHWNTGIVFEPNQIFEAAVSVPNGTAAFATVCWSGYLTRPRPRRSFRARRAARTWRSRLRRIRRARARAELHPGSEAARHDRRLRGGRTARAHAAARRARGGQHHVTWTAATTPGAWWPMASIRGLETASGQTRGGSRASARERSPSTAGSEPALGVTDRRPAAFLTYL